MQVDDAVAVVTGGASGLGAATVRRLHASGARVTILDRDGRRAADLAAELGGPAKAVAVDVTDGDQVAEAVRDAASDGPLRIAVSCAGRGDAQRTVRRDGRPHDAEVFSKVLAVNLIGTFHTLVHAAALMAASEPAAGGERGVIVNTASIAAYEGQIGQLAYSASKGGVVGMTLPAARDLGTSGIRVCTIAPGLMDTPLLGTLAEEARTALAGDVVFPGRLGEPAEFAALVQHIVENPYLNGAVIRLDGGLRMPPR